MSGIGHGGKRKIFSNRLKRKRRGVTSYMNRLGYNFGEQGIYRSTPPPSKHLSQVSATFNMQQYPHTTQADPVQTLEDENDPNDAPYRDPFLPAAQSDEPALSLEKTVQKETHQLVDIVESMGTQILETEIDREDDTLAKQQEKEKQMMEADKQKQREKEKEALQTYNGLTYLGTDFLELPDYPQLEAPVTKRPNKA